MGGDESDNLGEEGLPPVGSQTLVIRELDIVGGTQFIFNSSHQNGLDSLIAVPGPIGHCSNSDDRLLS